MYKTYDKLEEAEELLVSAKAKRRARLADKITGADIYKAHIQGQIRKESVKVELPR